MSEVRAAKTAVVDEIRDRLSNAESVIVTEYRGLSVHAISDLRRGLRTGGGRYRVYKNTLARRAADAAGTDQEFNELLIGPTGLAYTDVTPDGQAGDVVTLAKTLKEFSKANPDLVIKGGLFEGSFIDADGLNKLADVEPRDVLLAKLAGLMAAPMQQFAGLLEALPRNFAYGLKALIDQGGAPGAPAPAEDSAPASAEDSAPASAEDSAPASAEDSAPKSAEDSAAESPEAADPDGDSGADAASAEDAAPTEEAPVETEAQTQAEPAAEAEEAAEPEAADEPVAESTETTPEPESSEETESE